MRAEVAGVVPTASCARAVSGRERKAQASFLCPVLRARFLCLLFAMISPLLWPAAGFAQTPAQSTQPGQFGNQSVIRSISVIGAHRIPASTVKQRMTTREGDIYDQASIERDFNALWNTGYFEDLRFEREDTDRGVILHVYVKERPTIGEIKYVGLNSVTQSDVLDEFKKRKVNVTQESQYDPTKVKRAEVVLKEMLSAHGRQFAIIRTEIRQISASRVGVTFVVKEGPKVKVGRITFEGNKDVKSRELRAAMKGEKPYGIPHSLVFENLISRTFDAGRLADDTELVREALQNRGFLKAVVEDPKTNIHDVGSSGFHIPLVQKGRGKTVDIHYRIEEGERYRLASITFTGNKRITNEKALRSLFPLKDGDLYSAAKLRDGLKNLQKAYSEFGYINFTAVPDIKPDDDKKTVQLEIQIEEGKQFSVRRIEFQGNTTTRDKVIRRELLLDEGSLYNSRLWEFSLLRLNQLGYFNRLEPDKDTDVKRNEADSTVDLTLKVKEKQKNSIGLSGGVSGLEGSFIGLNYSTNNFLGLGETLSIALNLGNLSRSATFGFTEPYLFDRPIQTGFTVYGSKYNYNEAQQLNVLYGQKLNIPQSQQNLLQNYTQASIGFTASATYALHRSFKKVGLIYAFDITNIQTFSQVSQLLFEELNFRNISGPNALNGITTSRVQPNFSFSNVNGTFNPQGGHSLLLATDIAGLGGNTRYIRPIVDWKQFIRMKGFRPMGKNETGRHEMLAYHLQGSFITGYAGLSGSPFQRFSMGGEGDLRGFDLRSISPVAFITNRVDVPLLSPSDPCLVTGQCPACPAPNQANQCPTSGFGIPINPTNARAGTVSVPVPVNEIVFPGGDTMAVSNLEYRFELYPNHVVLSAFTDVGFDGILRQSQLKISSGELATLNSTAFGCPVLVPVVGCTGGAPQTFTADVTTVGSTNWKPRMSNGLELQVLMPIVNAPLRIYYAYNPVRLYQTVNTPSFITRNLFPAGGAGDATFLRTQSLFAPTYQFREPAHTFRFTVATTF